MRKGHTGRLAGILLLGAFLFLVAGCGNKTPPIPPQSIVPRPIGDLRYEKNDEGVLLTWSYPVKTIRGSVLDDISSFELYRAEVPIADYCGGCPIPFGEPIELDGGSPVDGKVRRKAGHQDSLLRAGYKYFFKVRSRASWWADSSDSNIITFTWYAPTEAPVGLAAIPGDQQVKLSWQPVTTYQDGNAVDKPMRYQVLRRVGGSGVERVGEPVSATEYVDRRVSNGLQYFYAIQGMMVIMDDLVGGGTSREVAATPADLIPPAAPTGVRVVRTDVGTKIFWNRSKATDLGGYRVYRRAATGKKYQLLGKVESKFTLFVDSKADNRVRYYYAVTAIDQATPPNESNKSKDATSRF